MSIEKLSIQAINRILEETSKSERRWRDNISQCFKDFTAIKAIEDVSLRGAELNYSVFKGITFHNVRFEDARLYFCDFSECSFDSCDFSDIRGAFANFQNSKFKSCLIDAPLPFANFESGLFSRCSFGNSNLLMANFKNAKFETSEALEVRFLDNSNTEGADLSGLRIDHSNYPSL